MLETGFLGTRADAFVDVAIVFFAAAPFLMTHALRVAAQRRYPKPSPVRSIREGNGHQVRDRSPNPCQ